MRQHANVSLFLSHSSRQNISTTNITRNKNVIEKSIIIWFNEGSDFSQFPLSKHLLNVKNMPQQKRKPSNELISIIHGCGNSVYSGKICPFNHRHTPAAIWRCRWWNCKLVKMCLLCSCEHIRASLLVCFDWMLFNIPYILFQAEIWWWS